MANNKIDEAKNEGKSTTISIAMVMQRYNVRRIAQWSTSRLHSKPLDAAIGQVPASYCPGGRHGR